MKSIKIILGILLAVVYTIAGIIVCFTLACATVLMVVDGTLLSTMQTSNMAATGWWGILAIFILTFAFAFVWGIIDTRIRKKRTTLAKFCFV